MIFGIPYKATLTLLAVLTCASLMGCDQQKKTATQATDQQTAVEPIQPQKPVYISKLLKIEVNSRISPMPGTIEWKPGTDAHLVYHAATGLSPKEIVFRRPTPNGFLEAIAYYDTVAAQLPIDFDDSDCVENDGLKDGCIVEIAEHDFDGDGTPEIIVAVGDASVSLKVNVIKYHPPATAADAIRGENWELVGKFDGQSNATVSKANIYLPYGSQGLVDMHSWVNGKFVDTN